MDDRDNGVEDGSAQGGRLVALPRRVLDDEEAPASFISSPSATVDDLLDRTNHLLEQLTIDIAHLKEDQEKERVRIVREAEERQVAAEAAIDRLRDLALKARQIAEHKARTDVLDAALAKKVPLDQNVTFEELVQRIEEEIRLAKGITGAIRLATIGDLLKQATLRVEYLTRQADRARERALKETETELHSEGKEARASYEIGMGVVRRDLKALDLALPPSGLSWDDKRWQHWEGWDPLSGASRWIRLGTYYRPQLDKFRFPALLELPGPSGLCIDVATGDRDVAVDAMRSILLRVVASMPPGDVRFTFIDPAGLGDSVAPLMALGEYQPELVDEIAYTLEDQIEAKLTECSKHIERVIQQHLRGDFETIEECNEHAGEIVEPYRVLAVFDFPTQMTDRSKKLLRTIIDNGPRCGVYTLMMTAPGAARANGAKWKGMTAGLIPIIGDPSGYSVTHELAGTWSVDFDRSPELAMSDGDDMTLFGRIVRSTGEAARQGRSSSVSQAKVFELLADALPLRTRDDLPDATAPLVAGDPDTWWSGHSERIISGPIGRAGARDVACLAFDSAGRTGTIVGGERGSGVSTLLHDAVLSLAMQYPPDELAFYVVDFSPVAQANVEAYVTEALPHARVIAVEAEREFGVSVLDGLVREMTRRAMLCAPYGGERGGITAYRKETGDGLPRILLVVDGIEALFATADRISDSGAQLLDTLVRTGAAYGIHLLVGTHAMSSLERVGRHTFDQLRGRIALACAEDESKRLLGADDGSACELEDAGEALIGEHDAGPGALRRFTTTHIEPNERGVCLRDLRRLADERGFTRRPQVFEGNAPARLEDSSVRTLAAADATRRQRLAPRLLLGEPVSFGGPVETTLRRESGANLLVVGRDERLCSGLVFAAMTSAVLGHGQDVDIRVLDFMPLESGFAELTKTLTAHVPVQQFRRRSIDDALRGVWREIKRRHDENDYRAKPLLFVVNGLGAARELDLAGAREGAKEPDGRREHAARSAPSHVEPAAILERIVRDGPEVGVHTVVWADAPVTMTQRLTRATIQSFALRVVLQLPASDSTMLIDSGAATTLKEQQALLYDEHASRLTKLRPYLLPSTKFVETVAQAAADDAGAFADETDETSEPGSASSGSGATVDAGGATASAGAVAGATTGRSTVSA